MDFQPKPCVGCGYCCKTATCIHGIYYARERGLPDKDTCPFLIERDGRYWCNLVLEGVVDTKELWIGEGCSSSMNSDRKKYEALNGKGRD